jgi:hypothetical protein
MPQFIILSAAARRLLLSSLALASLALALGACNQTATSMTKPATPALTIIANDTTLQMPKSIPAGLTLAVLQNHGKQPHQAQFALLNADVTADQVETTILQKGLIAALSLFSLSGGPGTVAPGKSQSVLLNLVAGNYVVLSLVPDTQGRLQADGDLIAPLSVVTRRGQPHPATPQTDTTILLQDKTISLPLGLDRPGPLTLKVINAGQQAHELAFVKVTAGETLHDALLSLEGKRGGPPPYTSAGGMAGLTPGGSGWLMLSLTPGKYLAFSPFPDLISGLPQTDLDLWSAFTVQ